MGDMLLLLLCNSISTLISHMNQQKINTWRSIHLEKDKYQWQFIHDTATESEPPHSRMWSLEYPIRGDGHSQEDEGQHNSHKTSETKKRILTTYTMYLYNSWMGTMDFQWPMSVMLRCLHLTKPSFTRLFHYRLCHSLSPGQYTSWRNHTPWSRVLLEKVTSFQIVKKSPHYVEPEGSLRHSQVPATCPYPKPAWSSSYPNILLPENPA